MSEASLGRALGTDEPPDVFELLSNQRRRYTVRALQDLEPPIEVGDLAEYIAAEENDTTVQALSSEERRRVYTSLQQTHLDRLERGSSSASATRWNRPTVWRSWSSISRWFPATTSRGQPTTWDCRDSLPV